MDSKAPNERATSVNMQLLRLQRDLRTGSISRDVVNLPSELCSCGSGMFTKVARLAPPDTIPLFGSPFSDPPWRRKVILLNQSRECCEPGVVVFCAVSAEVFSRVPLGVVLWFSQVLHFCDTCFSQGTMPSFRVVSSLMIIIMTVVLITIIITTIVVLSLLV